MKNQIELVKEIADGMEGIGGIPNNEEFYAEFDMRVREALGIERSKELLCAKCKVYRGVTHSNGWNKWHH